MTVDSGRDNGNIEIFPGKSPYRMFLPGIVQARVLNGVLSWGLERDITRYGCKEFLTWFKIFKDNGRTF